MKHKGQIIFSFINIFSNNIYKTRKEQQPKREIAAATWQLQNSLFGTKNPMNANYAT